MENLYDGSLRTIVDLTVDAGLSVSLDTENKPIPLGHGSAVLSVREQYQVFARYQCQIGKMKGQELLQLINHYNNVNESQVAFPFNDVSDNVVFPWNFLDAQQDGVLLQLNNNAQQYQLCKIYRFGEQQVIRPIRAVDQADNVNIYTSSGGLIDTADYVLDIDLGIVTMLNATVPALCDIGLYYVSVIFDGGLSITNLQDGGSVGAGIVDPALLEDTQEFTATFSLREVYPSYALNHELHAVSGGVLGQDGLFPSDYVSTLTDVRRTRVDTFEHNGLILRSNESNFAETLTRTSQGAVVKHSELWYFLTAYRASAGTGWTLPE